MQALQLYLLGISAECQQFLLLYYMEIIIINITVQNIDDMFYINEMAYNKIIFWLLYAIKYHIIYLENISLFNLSKDLASSAKISVYNQFMPR